MRFFFVTAILLAVNSLCFGQSQPLLSLREDARQIMRTRLCGVCHIPPGNERALKIYNLNNENWSKTMSDNQLSQIKWRIKVKGKDIEAQRGDPKKHQFTDKEIQTLIAYVDAEIKDRNFLKTLLDQ